MDEKTEELRDIFIDVAEEETVTERQTEGHGSLTDVDEAAITERLQAVIADMRERYDFETDCDDETLTTVVRRFYEGADDETIADALDADPETVFRARMDLHLIGEADTDAPLEMARLREAVSAGDDAESIADALDTDSETVGHYQRVAAAQNEARRASHRFQTAFEDALADADLSVQLTADVTEDGLDEATEDIETNVSF